MSSLVCALNKRLSKQSWDWWFETPTRSLWRHRNGQVWHTDVFWRHRTQSTLVPLTVCCLKAPSHYLAQYFLVCTWKKNISHEMLQTNRIQLPSDRIGYYVIIVISQNRCIDPGITWYPSFDLLYWRIILRFKTAICKHNTKIPHLNCSFTMCELICLSSICLWSS